MRRVPIRIAVASLVAATVVLPATVLTSGASPAVPSVAAAPKASFTSQCKAVRAKYPGLPRTIDIAVSPYNPPWESINSKNASQIIGLEPSMVSDLGRCLDFTYTYSSESFSAVVSSVQSGRSPIGITALFLTPAREKVVAFVPYMVSETQVVASPSIAPTIHTAMDLCGLSTGVTTGSIELGYFQKLSTQCTKDGKKAISINIFTNIATIFASLAAGRFDFTAGASFLTAPALKEYPGKLKTSILLKSLRFDVGISVGKKEVTLGHALTAAVQILEKTGIEKRLLKAAGFPATAQEPAVYTP